MKYFFFLFFLLSTNCFSQISFEEFLQVKVALSKVFTVLDTQKSELRINPISDGLEDNYWWNLEVSHASYVHIFENNNSVHNVFLMGGLAREHFMTPDGLLLIGCHEMGHGLAGYPYKKPIELNAYPVSVEGEADYFATNECLPVALDFLPQLRELNTPELYRQLCKKRGLKCIRMLTAIESELELLQRNSDAILSIEGTSDHIQSELNLSPYYYPDPQCRIQTMAYGALDRARPTCWFPKRNSLE